MIIQSDQASGDLVDPLRWRRSLESSGDGDGRLLFRSEVLPRSRPDTGDADRDRDLDRAEALGL
jgi:hypothetical protein